MSQEDIELHTKEAMKLFSKETIIAMAYDYLRGKQIADEKVEELELKLKKYKGYADHKSPCAVLVYGINEKCDCGYDELIKEIDE